MSKKVEALKKGFAEQLTATKKRWDTARSKRRAQRRAAQKKREADRKIKMKKLVKTELKAGAEAQAKQDNKEMTQKAAVAAKQKAEATEAKAKAKAKAKAIFAAKRAKRKAIHAEKMSKYSDRIAALKSKRKAVQKCVDMLGVRSCIKEESWCGKAQRTSIIQQVRAGKTSKTRMSVGCQATCGFCGQVDRCNFDVLERAMCEDMKAKRGCDGSLTFNFEIPRQEKFEVANKPLRFFCPRTCGVKPPAECAAKLPQFMTK